MLVAALLACGLVNGIAQLTSSAAIAGSIPARRQGTAFGVKEAAKPAATLLCGFAVPIVTLVDWRWAFAACAALALALLAPAPAPAPAHPRPRARGRARSRAGRPSPALVMLAAGAALGSAVGTTAGTFLVETATADGLSPAAAGALLAIGSVTSVVIRIVIGVRADRMSGGHLLRVAGLLAAGAPGFLLLAAGSGPLLVLGAMLAFGGGWGWAGSSTSRSCAGTAIGRRRRRASSWAAPRSAAARGRSCSAWSPSAGPTPRAGCSARSMAARPRPGRPGPPPAVQ